MTTRKQRVFAPAAALRACRHAFISVALALAATTALADGRFLATHLLDKEVVNRAGEPVGEIEHFMIDVPAGRVTYLLLGDDKAFELGRKLLAFAPGEFSGDTQAEKLVLDADPARLEQARGFYEKRWPAWEDAAPGQASRGSGGAAAAAPGQVARLRDDHILGRNVVTPDGEVVGKVKDLVVDLSDGRIVHVAIDVEDDARDATLPFAALAVRRIGGDVRLELAQEVRPR